MLEISKAQLIAIAETSEVLDYLGCITVGGEVRHYYRTTGVPGDKPRGYLVVYVVA